MEEIIYEHIVITSKNKEKLKKLGKMGDSYNDVIELMLNKMESK